MNQVFVCSSYFHLYVSILKILERGDDYSGNMLVLNDHIPEMELLIPRLEAYGFFEFYVKVPFTRIDKIYRKDDIISKNLFRNSRIIELVENNSTILDSYEFIRNAQINIFNNRGLAYTYFLLKFKDSYIRLIEDGLGNYYTLVTKFQAFKRKHLLRTVIGAGHDSSIKEILVQYPERMTYSLRTKGKKLDLIGIRKRLSEERINAVINVFMEGIELNIKGEQKLLLITQPLEELNISEEKKISIYNELLSRYNYYNIYIKPHPRDPTDYEGRILYPFKLIPRRFPLEMFELLNNVNFELGITICSSSLYNLNCIKNKIILGKEYLTKPLPQVLPIESN